MNSAARIALAASLIALLALAPAAHGWVGAAKARLAGESPAPYAPPCFLNPRHGGAMTAVDYEVHGQMTRVPACASRAADAAGTAR